MLLHLTFLLVSDAIQFINNQTPITTISAIKHRLSFLQQICKVFNALSVYLLEYKHTKVYMWVGYGLWALNIKLAKVILQIGWFSYHLTSWRKLTLMQKSTAQTLKFFISVKKLTRQWFKYKWSTIILYLCINHNLVY